MDHSEAIREMLAEKYLLDELSPDAREAFEEHFFGCIECAQDVRTGATLISGMKDVLAEAPVSGGAIVRKPESARSGWLGWLRPALAFPVLIVLIGIVAYQNLVSYPRLKMAANTPQVLPWASVNVSSRGANAPAITVHHGEGFLLFVNIPPDSRYSSYIAELHDPSGKLEWSLTVPATTEDSYPVHVPAANRAGGSYTVVVQGISATGEKSEVGRTQFELRVQN
jgi:hypothetical protein